MMAAEAAPADAGESFVVTQVPDNRRSSFLPRHIHGALMKVITFENTVYGIMSRICRSYQGGFWTFHEVSNGAFFMAPSFKEPVEIVVADNGFSGTLDPQAAGVVVTLMALSEMSFRYEDDERLSDAFHALRDYARSRDDFALIFGAID